MPNQVIGTILTVGPVQELTSKSGNAFLRRELTVAVRRFDPHTGEPTTDPDNTPQLVFIGDRCRDLDAYQPGQLVAVSFDVRGRRYTDAQGQSRIITDIAPFRIEPYQPRSYARSAAPQPYPAADPAGAATADPAATYAPQVPQAAQAPQAPQAPDQACLSPAPGFSPAAPAPATAAQPGIPGLPSLPTNAPAQPQRNPVDDLPF